MYRNIFLLFIGLSLTSCATAYQSALKQKVEARIAAECPLEEKGHVAELIRCRRDIVIAEVPSDPTLGMYVQKSNELVKIAELYDAGKISKDKYKALESDKKAEMVAYSAELNYQSAQASAQAFSNSMQQIGQHYKNQALINQQASQAAAVPTYSQPKQVQTRCIVNQGNEMFPNSTVNCTSH